MKIKTLRMHYDPECEDGDYIYDLFDREGKMVKRIDYPIQIFDLPKVKRFGFCPIESVDVTLEFEDELDSRKIKRNND